MKDFSEKIQKDDILMFINACFSSTGQNEFYESSYTQSLTISFLHEYMLVNYRELYFRFLGVGINHYNQAKIILNLLSTGKNSIKELRFLENEYITKSLKKLPSNRVYKLFVELKKNKVNNARTKAIVKNYLKSKKDLPFDVLKYRNKFKTFLQHTHTKIEKEVGTFIFEGIKNKTFTIELFENFRKAHHNKEFIYTLPFTVAEGLAYKHKIKRDTFLEKIQDKMTLTEKLRYQKSSEENNVKININLEKISLTKLILYILSLKFEERNLRYDELINTINTACEKIIAKDKLILDKTVCILDSSYSSSGSDEKSRRPLAIALGIHFLIKNSCKEYKDLWTHKFEKDLLAYPKGQTNISEQFISALSYEPKNIIIISDGYENDPMDCFEQIIKIYNKKFAKTNKINILHLNPVFEANNFDVKKLSDEIITLGIRDIEDFPLLWNFENFISGNLNLKDLHKYLDFLYDLNLKNE